MSMAFCLACDVCQTCSRLLPIRVSGAHSLGDAGAVHTSVQQQSRMSLLMLASSAGATYIHSGIWNTLPNKLHELLRRLSGTPGSVKLLLWERAGDSSEGAVKGRTVTAGGLIDLVQSVRLMHMFAPIATEMETASKSELVCLMPWMLAKRSRACKDGRVKALASKGTREHGLAALQSLSPDSSGSCSNDQKHHELAAAHAALAGLQITGTAENAQVDYGGKLLKAVEAVLAPAGLLPGVSSGVAVTE